MKPTSHYSFQLQLFRTTKWPVVNGRQFIKGHVSLEDILPNLLSEIYALIKKGNHWKYIDRILYMSLLQMCAKNQGNLENLPKCYKI